jgi:hypothetical protein
MRKWIISSVAVAALAFATPAKAQVMGYSSPSYGGFPGLSIGNGGILNSVLGGGYPWSSPRIVDSI